MHCTDDVVTIQGYGGNGEIDFYQAGSRDGYGNVKGSLGLDGTTADVTIDARDLIGGGSISVAGGFDGNDTMYGSNYNDTLNGGTGNDSLEGGAGNDLLSGGAGNDSIASASADQIARPIGRM